jgi:hypothetical protein
MCSVRLCPLAAVFVGCLLCLLVSGCQNKLTKGNLEKIKDGMSEEEVFAILGKGKLVTPDSDFSNLPGLPRSQVQALVASGTCYQWKSGRTILVVRFVDGKVTGQFSGSFKPR